MTRTSKMDKMVWAEYSSAGDELVEEATEVFLNRFDAGEPGVLSKYLAYQLQFKVLLDGAIEQGAVGRQPYQALESL